MEQIGLTPQQKQAIDILIKNPQFLKEFYFTGGTALSICYLKHRYSDDLDFFTDRQIELRTVSIWVKNISEQLKLTPARFEHLFDRYIFYINSQPELKIEFTRYPYPALAEKNSFLGMRVDSLLDIATNKLFTIFDRNEPKDFVDLFFLLKKFSIETLITGVKQKFSFTVTPLTLGSELLKVRHLPVFPKTVRNVNKEDVIAYFEDLARKYGQNVIDPER